MKRGISGFVCVRNAEIYDYCVVSAVKSLIPVCDEVVVCDGESTDRTLRRIEDIGDSRIRVITYPWKNPIANDRFWVEWLNYARERLDYDYQLTLDADEVLDPRSHDKIREFAADGICGLFDRLNFWMDIRRLAPKNTVCGDTVARCGPSSLYCCSDEPSPAVTPNIRTNARYHPDLRIFHYGFVRDPSAFLRKSKDVQKMFTGSCDARILGMEATGRIWNERDYFDGAQLESYLGPHPEAAHGWLREKGFSP